MTHKNALLTEVHSNYFLDSNFNFKIIISDLALHKQSKQHQQEKTQQKTHCRCTSQKAIE